MRTPTAVSPVMKQQTTQKLPDHILADIISSPNVFNSLFTIETVSVNEYRLTDPQFVSLIETNPERLEYTEYDRFRAIKRKIIRDATLLNGDIRILKQLNSFDSRVILAVNEHLSTRYIDNSYAGIRNITPEIANAINDAVNRKFMIFGS